jgi:hypothetical protein
VTPKLVLGFTLRSVVLWILVRLVLLTLMALIPRSFPGASIDTESSPLSLSPVMAAGIAVLVSALLMFDVRAMRERVFLENLGVPLAALAGLAFAIAALLEFAVATLVR